MRQGNEGLLSDEIYEAAFDAGLFDRLPDLLAAAVGARSAVLHWDDRASRSSVAAMNRHFSADDMALYEREFAPYDLWSQAVSAVGHVNHAWRMSELVPEAVYRNGVLFNEWNRAIGDDTVHCIGGSMDTALGQGCIGLHRGDGAGDFDTQSVQVLEPLVRPLARVLSMRAAIAAERERADTFAQFFHAQGSPALLISSSGRVLEANGAADTILFSGSGPVKVVRERLTANGARDKIELETAIGLASRAQAPVGGTLSLSDPAGTNWFVDVTPIHRIEGMSGAARALVTLRRIDAAVHADPAIEVLRSLYGLTLAEAQVAIAIAHGDSPTAIAASRGTARETVRSQIKQIMGKLGVRRQSGIAALVASLG